MFEESWQCYASQSHVLEDLDYFAGRSTSSKDGIWQQQISSWNFWWPYKWLAFPHKFFSTSWVSADRCHFYHCSKLPISINKKNRFRQIKKIGHHYLHYYDCLIKHESKTLSGWDSLLYEKCIFIPTCLDTTNGPEALQKKQNWLNRRRRLDKNTINFGWVLMLSSLI